MYQAYYDSELGLLEITANEEGITSVIFVEDRKEEHKNELVEQCINELDEYFEGKEKSLQFHCLLKEHHSKRMYGMHFTLFRMA